MSISRKLKKAYKEFSFYEKSSGKKLEEIRFLVPGKTYKYVLTENSMMTQAFTEEEIIVRDKNGNTV